MLIEGGTERSEVSGWPPARSRCLLVGALLLALASCRIYREDRSPSSEPEAAATGRTLTPGTGGAGSEEPSSAASPSPESLSLWVLNRPTNDLKAQAPQAPGPGSEPPPEAPRVVSPARALVVLGLGTARPCATVFAERALGALLASDSPGQVVSSLLEELRRFRWPGTLGTLEAAQQGSDGSFGAVHAATPAAFTSALLDLARQRHGVLDGQSARFGAQAVAPPTPPAAPAGCDVREAEGLRGPAAVLVRSAAGQFHGGLIELTGPNDAGLVPSTTQYSVALAMGETEGVVLVSDCPAVPPAAWAEAARKQLAAGQPVATHPADCQLGHALMTRDDAWVSSTGALAWASAAASPTAPPPPAPAERDAGAASTGSPR